MKKNFYILLLIICFSFTKNNKSISKNLRKLDLPTVTLTKADNLIYIVESGVKKLKFDITLSSSSSTTSGTYKITILYRGEKKEASCSLSGTSMNCEYTCDSPHYGSIEIWCSSNGLETNTINLKYSSGTKYTLKYKNGETFSLTYNNAVIGLQQDGSPYNIQVYLSDSTALISLADNTYLDLALDISTGYTIAGCTYSSSSKKLDCNVSGSLAQKVKFITDQKDGTIKWTNSAFAEDSIIMNVKAQTSIYGYDLDFINNKWKFKVHLGNTDITFNGYYCYLNVILKNKANEEASAKALCHRKESKNFECELSEGTQTIDDLVYISSDQTEATVFFESDLLNDKKLMIRLITLKFKDAYELKYDNKKWKFKIEVEAEGTASSIVREGLNVTVALFRSGDGEHTASCLYSIIDEKKILSCERDKNAQYEDDLILLIPQKSVGSVTWSNSNDYSENIKIPLEVELTHVLSYYLVFENSKWTFKIDAKPTSKIPSQSFIIANIVYDEDKYTTAKCLGKSQNAGTINANAQTTYTCECNLDETKSFQISNNKGSGSITWNSLTQPITIEKKIELSFVEPNNMKAAWTSSGSKWTFEFNFENTKALNLDTSKSYSLDISYIKEGENTFHDTKASCQLKSGLNTFSCVYGNSNSYKTYILYIRPTITIDSTTINWINLNERKQINLNAELTFKKGSLSYNNNWFLNIEVTVPSNAAFPLGSKLIIDINEGTTLKTMECIAASNALKCDTKISTTSVATLPNYSLERVKTEASSVKWLNTETDDSFYYFFLFATLDFVSAKNLNFDNNMWKFTLFTSNFPDKTKLRIDILYGGIPSTATCVKDSTILCTLDNTNQSKDSLVKIYRIKGSESTISWNNVLEDKCIITNADLNVESIKHLSYESNKKWEFIMNVKDCDLPLNSAVQIDIQYQSSPNTATCILTSETILTCIPDVDDQQKSHILAISYDKNLGSVSYSNSAINLIIQESKELTFEKVYDLTLKENKWEFKVRLTQTNLNDNDSIDIDVKRNGSKTKAGCKLNSKILTCTIDKSNNSDRLILINNDDNQDLVWSNLDEDIELYVSYIIKFVNCYGGFHENKWKFNLKYETNTYTINAIDNYALLDILVDNAATTAKCKITQKFLLCESQHDTQDKDDIIKLYGSINLGTISFSNTLSDSKKDIKPISLTLENPQIADFDSSNNPIKFKIKGNLKDYEDGELAENTISEVALELTKKDGTKTPLDTICFTNSINEGESAIVLSCEASGTVNENEDKLYIKVDSDGKSNYITFSSIKENIKIINYEDKLQPTDKPNDAEAEATKTPDEKASKKESGFIIKTNYIFLFGLLLLF